MDEARLKREFEVMRKARQLIEKALTEFGPFVSLVQASRETGISLQTLAAAVRAERVPALNLLGKRRVRVSAARACYEADDEDEDLRVQRALHADGLLDTVRPLHATRFTPFRPVKTTDTVAQAEGLAVVNPNDHP